MSGEHLGEASSDLLERGYRVVQERVDEAHFGDTLLVLSKDTVNIRLIRERGQWFAEISFTEEPDEWFDFAIVSQEINEPVAQPPSSVALTVQQLLLTAPRWELLFSRHNYPAARKRMKALKAASARDRFGYTA